MRDAHAWTDRLRAACEPYGLDLIQPLSLGVYNQRVDGALRLEDFGDGSHLGVVIGNSRALWPRFLDALRRQPARLAGPDPLDRYVEHALESVLARLGVETALRLSHEGGRRRVAMQRLAASAGLAYLSESHLSVHPTYGPWIGLRAAVSLRVPGPGGSAPPIEHPCGSCRRGCLPAFQRAVQASARIDAEAVRSRWELWLAVRDACPTGRAHRYSDSQIRYHYLEDRQELRAAVLARRSLPNGAE